MRLPREIPDPVAAPVAAAFHLLFYRNHRRTWGSLSWLGVPLLKCPFDLWVYQEIVFDQRPDVVIETGTYKGGSALFFASLFDLLGNGRVLTIDVDQQPDRPQHPRIDYLAGSSTDSDIVAAARSATAAGRVMVVLDSDHRREHVARELELYAPLVTAGSYLIVEDTNVNGHPVRPRYGPGPMEAVREFLPNHPEFMADRMLERLYLTFNPGGYLRRSNSLTSHE